MELLKKIREGELAICDTGTHGQLLNAMNIIWPDYEVRPADGGLGIYYFSNTRGQWCSESDPMRLYPTILGSVQVPDFLREYREWEDKHIETKRPDMPEEIAKNQRKAFEPKSGLFSGIGNPKPEDIHVGGKGSSLYDNTHSQPQIDWEETYEAALNHLKKAASNMGKTVRVELEDKVKFRIQHIVTTQEPHKRWFSVSMSDFSQNNQKMYDIFLKKQEHILKAIEDILNED